jgi:hypothetical protein
VVSVREWARDDLDGLPVTGCAPDFAFGPRYSAAFAVARAAYFVFAFVPA